MQEYKRVCVGCNKEFLAGSINGRYCKAPACRKMCKSGTRGIVKDIPVIREEPEVLYAEGINPVKMSPDVKIYGQKPLPEKQKVMQPEHKVLSKTATPKKEVVVPQKKQEKKEPGVVILRIKGKEYIPGLSDNPVIWAPVAKPVETREKFEEAPEAPEQEGTFDYEEHQGTNT